MICVACNLCDAKMSSFTSFAELMAEDKRLKNELAAKTEMEAYLDKLGALQGLGLDLEAGKIDLPSEMGVADAPVMSETSTMAGQDITFLSSEDVVVNTEALLL